MNCKEIQRKDQAGHTKLTLVSIGHGKNRCTAFMRLRHNDAGQAILPQSALNTMLDNLHTRRGDTYTVG